MASEVHELAVRLVPQGGDEVSSEMENAREEFQRTADEAGDSATTLDRFANKWTGAGLVFAGTFGTLTAAIASRMPIIGQISNSLEQVLTSLALKIDEDVRPSLGDLADEFSNLATEIDKSESAPEAVGTALAGVINIIEDREPLDATVTVDFLVEVGEVFLREQEITERFEERSDEVGRIQASIEVATDIVPVLPPGLRMLSDRILEEWSLQDIITEITKWAIDISAILQSFGAVWRGILSTVWELSLRRARVFLNNLAEDIERRLNPIIDALNEVAGTNFSRVSFGRFQTESVDAIRRRNRAGVQQRLGQINAQRFTQRQQAGDDVAQLLAALQNKEVTHQTNINGRNVAETTRPFLGEGVGDRGR